VRTSVPPACRRHAGRWKVPPPAAGRDETAERSLVTRIRCPAPAGAVSPAVPASLGGSSPATGFAAHPCLITLAGAVGSATGLSLRSLRESKIFSREQKTSWTPGPPGCAAALSACGPSGAGKHHRQEPRRRGATKGARHDRHRTYR
jgi:hypothetical protein